MRSTDESILISIDGGLNSIDLVDERGRGLASGACGSDRGVSVASAQCHRDAAGAPSRQLGTDLSS